MKYLHLLSNHSTFLSCSFLFTFLSAFDFIYNFSKPAPANFTFPMIELIIYCSGKAFKNGFYTYVKSGIEEKYPRILRAAFPFFKPPGTNLTLNLFYFID